MGWGGGGREENRHSRKSQRDRQIIRNTGEENTTERTNRERIGNLLIKAHRTGDSIVVRVYISPTQTRERQWHCHGTRLCAPPGLASPYSPGHASVPYNTSLSPFPGLCARGINRIDGAPAVGQNFLAFSPAPNPRAGRRVSLCAKAVVGCGCGRGRRCFHLALWGECPCLASMSRATARWRQEDKARWR